MGGGVISSPRNPRVAAAARLQRSKARRTTGLTLLEGPHLLGEAVRASATVEEVFALAGDRVAATLAAGSDAELHLVTKDVLQRLAPTEHPRGPVAVLAVPPPQPIPGHNAVVLWGVGDPGNAGAIIRNAAAFGAAVAAGPGTVDLWSPKALRAGAGAHFRCRLALVERIDDLEAKTVVATVPRRGAPLASVQPEEPWALLVGDEAHGLPADLVDGADLAVTIPMPGATESLNAASAAAIVLYALTAAAPSLPGNAPPDTVPRQ